ncbi:hypothetical protein GIB67_015567 [Kingdonia uniflora]|uniref:Uncharacterized protein n=1 Tax=Kingdonia uniflora TaxID=39325 RepID=A0A7J7LU62_9MAGN|nr:hypothetical protein GIB67_015567 [Kingdonia uniflora]
MDRWNGFLKISLNPNTNSHYNVAASLCISPSSKTLIVPSANAIFFNGDRVEGTGNPLIERLSDTRNIAEILVSKLGVTVNAYVVEASNFNGSFVVYDDFIPSVNSWGKPKCYDPRGFPASNATVLLLSKCLEEAKKLVHGEQQEPLAGASTSCTRPPKTILFGFSKGGIILNQLVTELAYSKLESPITPTCIILDSRDVFLNNIYEIHYIDVGLNSAGAYITDHSVIEKIAENRTSEIRFVLHGTPRQWCDRRRPWIREEKDILFQMLEDAARKTAGQVQVLNRFYFSDRHPNLQMHFEIIESLDVS